MDAGVWTGLLERYGQRVRLRRGGEEREIRAFFQPVRDWGEGEAPTPLGPRPRGKWRYLGPPEENLEGVEELAFAGRRFRLIQVKPAALGEKTAYYRAVAEEVDGGDGL